MQEDRNLNNDKNFEDNITIIVGASNIFTNMFVMMEKFINERCVSKLYALVRGGILSRFHMQMESMIFIYSLLGLNKLFKN